MKFRWWVAPPQPLLAGQLAREFNIPPIMAQCLLNRSLTDSLSIGAFLQPRLKQLSDPFLLPNMTAAVDRLFRARDQREPVVIFGDYDVDGVTSAALLVEVLRALGWTVSCYLPNRLEEGYGLSAEAIAKCLAKCPTPLLIAVDCGSTAVESIRSLQERGVDVIVLDHHPVSSPAPAAAALINPQLQVAGPLVPEGGSTGRVEPGSGSTRPLTELCSAGLAFKLAHALIKRGRALGLQEAVDYDLRPLLDLVALGTVADVVPLVGENRILVSAGLQRLNTTARPGLLALKRAAQCAEPAGVFEIGFQLAPRLNAAGRLETAQGALELLLTREMAVASALAQKLEVHNRERQKIERGIAEEAIRLVRSKFNPATDFVIVEGHSAWHIGVVGIVASRVLQQFYRPTIIVGGDNGEWRGSGRSIAGFDLAASLRECAELLNRHGGHAMAAGLSLNAANLDAFRAKLNELARRQLHPETLQPPLHLDADIKLAEITLPCLAQFEQFNPIGQGNPALQFCARNLTHLKAPQRMGAEKQHVKMWVTDGGAAHEVVWWGAASQELPSESFDLAFCPKINDFNGRRSVQLKALDWRPQQATPAAM